MSHTLIIHSFAILRNGIIYIEHLESSRYQSCATGSTVSYRYDSFSAANGPLIKYVKLRLAHAPGMPETFSPSLTSKETASWPSRAVMHVGIANSQWRGKRSRHSRSMRNPQFYVSGKRPILWNCHCDISRVSLAISFLKLYLPFMDIRNSG